ncbi:hypothetical protein [Bacillus pseudomycoides]|uniref:Tetratricopeptide repeat protein n=1 Tax=Bacillus pseudomycoides TaxID=64104 RepID=A0ABD6TBG0_9BACI|nr:hypothetical protein [Bacillus pseudomycoides]EEM03562.1 hypothetical protein bmyco0002_39970 [Bacillus pseudomycoides]PFW97348.1 hypothetical protein COL29_04845 [Bacillus pseudomycoides]PFX47077.1 hypothetical protein COL32_03425 [Bacillus pseudomycoides]PGC42156.1 hypothetical protein COM18_08370 [Bacillus pseudomycoides]PGF09834.1 hypothetical protein COM59_05985 [Bacillus pseudomycoides]
MQIENIPFEMGYTFDENLREKPLSLAEMKQGITFLKTNLAHSDISYAKQCGLIGVYDRIVENLSESKYYLQKAIERYEALQHTQGIFINKLHLAHVYHWESDFEKANEIFAELFHMLHQNDLTNYEDFLYQHYGKSKLDEGDLNVALPYFQKALQIRMKKGNEELIRSTELCIQHCSSRL